jgi:phenylalanyl-tRNA synthetase beta chain
MGLELDDVTSEANEIAKGQKKPFNLKKEHPEKIQWKIEVPANRYDLLCPDGLARAFRIFLGLEKDAPVYSLLPAAKPCSLKITKDAEPVRKFMVCAILRDIDFTARPGLFRDFLNLQDKLHTNICRKRKLVSIGTHDLDKIQGPFSYGAEVPTDIKFVPLQRNWMGDDIKGKSMNAKELFELLRQNGDPCGSYLHLVENAEKWPVLRDATGEVLSLPPILNGEYSAMTENTKNVFIDVTAIDYTKAKIVLNTIIAMFSQFCKVPYSAESVEVTLPDGETKKMYPQLGERNHVAHLDYVNSILGLKLTGEEALGQLQKMGLRGTFEGPNTLNIAVPITRSDIMHECDIAEDVAIAYGYQNLTKRTPFTDCFGEQFELNKFTDLLRDEIARCLYSEILTEVLVSWEENYDKLQKPRDDKCVVLSAPKSRDFEIGRTSIMPGVLKSLRTNRSVSLPLRLFQIDDVMLRDSSTETGSRNERRICAAYCNKAAGLENIHGLVDKIFEVLSITAPPNQLPYVLKESLDSTFFPGRCVTIHLDGIEVGIMGVVHPLVLKAFQLPNPVSLCELNLEILEKYVPGSNKK